MAKRIPGLPDGSSATVASFPLPAGHWLLAPGTNDPPMPLRVGRGQTLALSLTREQLAEAVRAAGRYAARATTMNGRLDDFDPDALVGNFVVGLLGYFTPDGRSDL